MAPPGQFVRQDATVVTKVIPEAVIDSEQAQGVVKANDGEDSDGVKEIYIDADKYPEAAKNLEEAIEEGYSNEGVIDRKGAESRRRTNLKGIKTEKGKDRDEAPPAVIDTGNKSKVKKIPSSDNRGAGASIGDQLRNLPNGTKVRILPKKKGK